MGWLSRTWRRWTGQKAKPQAQTTEELIRQQNEQNRNTQNTNTITMAGNQVGPDGSTRNVTTRWVEDPNNPGSMIAVNDTTTRFGASTQGLYDQATGVSSAAMGNVRQDIADARSGVAGRNVENMLNRRWLDVNAPELDRQQRAAEALQRRRGIGAGSAAGDRAGQNFARWRSDAENRAFVNNWGQAQNTINANRNYNLGAAGAGINWRNAMTNPTMQLNQTGAGSAQQANVDTTAASNAAFNQQQQAYNNAFTFDDVFNAATNIGAQAAAAYAGGGFTGGK